MPKKVVKKKEPQRDLDKELIEVIEKYLFERGMNKKELAIYVHMPESTLYARFKKPEDFRLVELRKIFEVLNFSEEDKAAVKW